MPPQPPSFGSQQYWNNRFTANSNPFEWLEAPTALDPYLLAAVRAIGEEYPEILHIGCGTSLLSYHLRAHVKQPKQVHNLDYSDVAIRVGRQREVDIFSVDAETQSPSENHEATLSGPSHTIDATRAHEDGTDAIPTRTASDQTTLPSNMRWSSANLLSHSSLLDVCTPATYSIIVDKSTSDSIACADDIYVPLPYFVRTASDTTCSARFTESPEPIHPLHIMAIHMALLTKPGARWISLSYSEDRYPFLHLPLPLPPAPSSAATSNPLAASASASALAPQYLEGDDPYDSLDDDLDDIPQQVLDSGLPDPAKLWRLEGKFEIEVPPSQPAHGAPSHTVTHRPKVLHWVYVLERTDVEVSVRSFEAAAIGP